MKKYQVWVYVPQDEDWNDIDVVVFEIEAFNCNDAKQQAVVEAESRYEDCYVWEVTEEHII